MKMYKGIHLPAVQLHSNTIFKYMDFYVIKLYSGKQRFLQNHYTLLSFIADFSNPGQVPALPGGFLDIPGSAGRRIRPVGLEPAPRCSFIWTCLIRPSPRLLFIQEGLHTFQTAHFQSIISMWKLLYVWAHRLWSLCFTQGCEKSFIYTKRNRKRNKKKKGEMIFASMWVKTGAT